jgi:hypothetical protein
LFTGICGELFFNPLPTFWHGLLFYLVPISMFVNFFLLKQDPQTEKKYVRTLSRILMFYSLTVSTAFSIWFLTIVWISIIGVIFFGIGLLGLSPFALLLFSIVQIKQWYKKYEKPKLKFSPYWAFGAGTLLTAALLWSTILLRIAADVFTPSVDPRVKNTMLKIIEKTVSRDELREQTVYHPTLINDWLGYKYDCNRFAEAYFYIYGKRPGIPEVVNGIRRSHYEWDWDWDSNLGSGMGGDHLAYLHCRIHLSTSRPISRAATATSNGRWSSRTTTSGARPKLARSSSFRPTPA